VCLALLREFGGPLAAPSANRFGRVSPTTAAHVLSDMAGRVDLILDGGPCTVGLESTIVDCTGGNANGIPDPAPPAILRPGGITPEQIAAVLQSPLSAPTASAPRVSGSMPSHYAPRARVEIVSPAELRARAEELAARGERVAVFSRDPQTSASKNVIMLTIPSSDEEWGASLYASLRRVDELGCDAALVTLPAPHGLGVAIADRLRRAAAERSGN
jgi:L-threonylcarbamoyladenylate synthase